MAEILLSEHDLESIERLLGAGEPANGEGELLPDGVLRTLADLFPAAIAGVVELDRVSGTVLCTQSFPPGRRTGPVLTLRAVLPLPHPRRVAHLFLARARPPFTARDRILFQLLVPSLHVSHPDGAVRLSPSELRVLGLVAQGASNREVSAVLSLSVATVRKHLEHIYLKLGVCNRTAAAARTFLPYADQPGPASDSTNSRA